MDKKALLIDLISGRNDCRWNKNGRCVNEKINGVGTVPSFLMEKSDVLGCTYTQKGVELCSEYGPKGNDQ